MYPNSQSSLLEVKGGEIERETVNGGGGGENRTNKKTLYGGQSGSSALMAVNLAW